MQSAWDIEARPWLVTGAALVLAGLFQFSDLKDRCLQQCVLVVWGLLVLVRPA